MEVHGKNTKALTSRARGATGGYTEDVSESHVHVCQPCAREDDTEDATGFCQQCNEYICASCIKFHRRSRATKNHVILQGDNMPHIQPRDLHDDDEVYEFCRIHSGLNSAVKYYCRAHDQVSCGDCIVTDHPDCKIEYIKDVTKEMMTTQTLDELNSDLQAVSVTFDQCKTSIPDILECNSVAANEVIKDMKEFHTKFMNYMDEQKQNVADTIDKNNEDDQQAMAELSSQCNEARSEIGDLIGQLESTESEDNRRFTVAKSVQSRLKVLQKAATDVTNACNARRRIQKFVAEPAFVELLTSHAHVGKLVQKNTDTASSGASVSTVDNIITTQPSLTSSEASVSNVARSLADISSAKLEFVEDIGIGIGMDGDNSNNILGMANLTRTTLVLADRRAQRASVLDITTNSIQAHLRLSSEPWDITALTHTEVAVTLPMEHKIQILAYQNNTLRKTRAFNVSGFCVGIDHNKNILVVCYFNPGKVELMDTQGHVLNKFQYNDDGSRMFSVYPDYAIFTRNGEDILVSDLDNHTITRLSTTGHKLAVYKPQGLCNPLGMCVCDDGSVMVCGWGSDNIQLLSQEGNIVREVLTKGDGLGGPNTLALSHNMDMLYVACGDSNYIKAFRIVYK